MNAQKLEQCARLVMEAHALGEVLSEYVFSDKFLLPSRNGAFTSTIVTEFDSFRGFKTSGEVNYKISLWTRTDKCSECFLHFAMAVAGCCGCSLVQVKKYDRKPYTQTTATLSAPVSTCVMCIDGVYDAEPSEEPGTEVNPCRNC